MAQQEELPKEIGRFVTACGYVLGQRVDIATYDVAVKRILAWARACEGRYVCVSNVHMVMEGHDNESFRKIVNDADMVTADGIPLVWALRLCRRRGVTQIRGATLMSRLIAEAAQTGITVGFYGGESQTLKLLITRVSSLYPKLNIAYSYSPPFRELSDPECYEIISTIKASGARLIFVGLGCPKQERWMAQHARVLNTVLIGTGAAFDFLAGTKPEAPSWMQQMGFEWLFRLLSEPERLWRRYFWHNSRFVLLLCREFLSR